MLRERVVLAVLCLAAMLGAGAGGCITAFAPNIRREEHHTNMTPASTRGDCLACHETESQMTARMKGMSADHLAHHMREMQTIVRPSLVQDWMVKDRRGCVECHRVKGSA